MKKIYLLGVIIFALIFFVLSFFYFKGYRPYYNKVTSSPGVYYAGKSKDGDIWSPSSGIPKPSWVDDTQKVNSQVSQLTPTPQSSESSPFASLTSSLSSDLAKWRQFRLSVLPTYEWDDWDWQTGYIFVDIVSVDKINKKLSIYTIQPIDQALPSSSLDAPITVSTNCPQESSAVTDSSMENYIKTNINIFDVPISNTNRYSLWTQCSNEECSLVGDICILVPVTTLGGQ